MNKSIWVAVYVATLAWPVPPAAQAEDGSNKPQAPAQAPAASIQSAGAPAASKSTKKPFTAGRLPLYLAGIAAGACLGMPVSLVRRTIWEEKQGIQGLCGDSTNKVAIVSAGAFWLPFSAFLGAVEAPVMGPVNSLRNYDKPFSKDQFSLGALGDGGGGGRDPG